MRLPAPLALVLAPLALWLAASLSPVAAPGTDDGVCDIESRTAAVNAECCDEASEDCTGGAPRTCNAGCAAVLEPYWRDCQSTLSQLGGGAFEVLQSTIVLCSSAAGPPPTPNTARLLTETAFIMTHDSATGYLNGNGHPMAGVSAGPTYDEWMKTQTAPACAQGTQPAGADCSFSFAGQLDCGARALDLRPTLQPNGDLYMHHGKGKRPSHVPVHLALMK